jgi:hypothetical protein
LTSDSIEKHCVKIYEQVVKPRDYPGTPDLTQLDAIYLVARLVVILNGVVVSGDRITIELNNNSYGSEQYLLVNDNCLHDLTIGINRVYLLLGGVTDLIGVHLIGSAVQKF